MQIILTVLATCLALANAAPVTVTETVVVATQYVTTRINGSPYTLASEVISTPTDEIYTTVKSESVPETTSEAIITPLSSSIPAPEPTIVPSSSNITPTTTSSSSTSTTSDSSLNTFEAAILEEHNIKRALHGASPLSWDAELAKYAADYAAKSFSCDNVQLIHSGGPYGENLAAGYVGGAAPVDAWYDEIKDYDYSNPGFSMATGHFTQVIWASTTKVGCAMVTCNNAWRQYTICEYSPAGNVIGYFEQNVAPVRS